MKNWIDVRSLLRQRRMDALPAGAGALRADDGSRGHWLQESYCAVSKRTPTVPGFLTPSCEESTRFRRAQPGASVHDAAWTDCTRAAPSIGAQAA